VDLNPVRAAIDPTPEQSAHTSVKARLESLLKDEPTAPYLFPFSGNPRENMPEGIPFRLMDYLELVEWTGRQIRDNKRGHIENTLPSLLTRLGLEPDCWINTCTRIECGNIVGSESAVKAALPHLNRQRVSGIRLPDR
ncbi:transposase, partial [Enterovibrio sp. ZSDZ35]|nr:transposase [Enterovibrio sp. ZSDZ35]